MASTRDGRTVTKLTPPCFEDCTRRTAREGFSDGKRPVRAAAIDDDDLIVAWLTEDARERHRKRDLFVVGGDNDGDHKRADG